MEFLFWGSVRTLVYTGLLDPHEVHVVEMQRNAFFLTPFSATAESFGPGNTQRSRASLLGIRPLDQKKKKKRNIKYYFMIYNLKPYLTKGKWFVEDKQEFFFYSNDDKKAE